MMTARDQRDIQLMGIHHLGDNGGLTPTRALLSDSPAIDLALGATCLAIDQRGALRPVGTECDAGSFERGATFPSCTDLDGDGYSPELLGCGPVDCNDDDAAVHPGAVEIPDNGIDDDCDAVTPTCGPASIAYDPVSDSVRGDLGVFMLPVSILGLALLRRRRR